MDKTNTKAKTTRKKSSGSLVRKVFLTFFITAIMVGLVTQSKRYNEVVNQIAVVDEQLSAEREKNVRLKEQQEYYKSDEYIEKMAREHLGYVKSDEIVFKNKSEGQ